MIQMLQETYEDFGFDNLDLRKIAKICRNSPLPEWEYTKILAIGFSARATQATMTREEAQQAAYPLLAALARDPGDESLWAALWLVCGPTWGMSTDASAHRVFRWDIADIFDFMAKAKTLPRVPGKFKS